MNTLREHICTYKRQCEVWMVNLGYENILGHEQKGTRPFYIISSDEYNEKSKTPIGFLMSTSEKKQKNKFTYTIASVGGHVNVSQIRTISEERFLRYIGISTQEDLKNIMGIFVEQIM